MWIPNPMKSRAEIKNRVELDKRLKSNGYDAGLFKNEEVRDKAEWVLKKARMGGREKMRPSELR